MPQKNYFFLFYGNALLERKPKRVSVEQVGLWILEGDIFLDGFKWMFYVKPVSKTLEELCGVI